ncbi:hypothetical protein QYS48_30285 [Marivirga arenosa]|uniref:Uncharacterized protein n=1 Tax=Marivirga arenosa TaxID=3059076 RepID=A0AA51RBE8_9BACT|nr:hypothetical protein [Marivirga sp. ABR2-2]WMN07898.1 hypothetical protein QYS48_30285 [Marivirga sp. ABR2-2]
MKNLYERLMVSLFALFICVLSIGYCHQKKNGNIESGLSLKSMKDLSTFYAATPQ